jgi:hypothetical protein
MKKIYVFKSHNSGKYLSREFTNVLHKTWDKEKFHSRIYSSLEWHDKTELQNPFGES